MATQFIYGKQPVAEAERGRRRVQRVWRAPETSPEELERLCGSPDHQGVVAEVEPYPYAGSVELLRAENGWWSRSIRFRIRTISARSPVRPRRRVLPGWYSRAPRSRGDTGCVQDLGGSGRAPAESPRCAIWLIGSARRRRPASGSRAPMPRGSGAVGCRPEWPRGAGVGRGGQGPAPRVAAGLRWADRSAHSEARSSR